MSTALLRVPLDALSSGDTLLDETTSRYLLRVHRLTRGDRVLVFDPIRALEAEGELVDDRPGHCVIRVEPSRCSQSVPENELVLVQGAGKGDKLEHVVRDATALGVTRIIVVDADRSQRRPASDFGAKQERWHRVSVQAARQCGRGNIPRLGTLPSFEGALEDLAETHQIWVLDPAGSARLGALLARLTSGRPLAVCIGPEGGWSPSELERAAASGALRVRAWPHTLRTETAATALLGAIAAASFRGGESEDDSPVAFD